LVKDWSMRAIESYTLKYSFDKLKWEPIASGIPPTVLPEDPSYNYCSYPWSVPLLPKSKQIWLRCSGISNGKVITKGTKRFWIRVLEPDSVALLYMANSSGKWKTIDLLPYDNEGMYVWSTPVFPSLSQCMRGKVEIKATVREESKTVGSESIRIKYLSRNEALLGGTWNYNLSIGGESVSGVFTLDRNGRGSLSVPTPYGAVTINFESSVQCTSLHVTVTGHSIAPPGYVWACTGTRYDNISGGGKTDPGVTTMSGWFETFCGQRGTFVLSR